MSGIQRYEPWPQEWPMEDANGDLVTYEDHVKVVEELAEALRWYGEQSRLARLIHSEGDAGRHAIAADGGKRAAAALAKIKEQQA